MGKEGKGLCVEGTFGFETALSFESLYSTKFSRDSSEGEGLYYSCFLN